MHGQSDKPGSVGWRQSARANVNGMVQSLLQDIKQIAGWGADGVIIGSAKAVSSTLLGRNAIF
ncbi:hypothetical protein E2562_020041 [Oryza meyeriana var. granulata]|uniref:Uncharacterized protein n=1 Tax=Oryza meyeriana var. granulata TaxID=110450 RepID=A0A6G1FAQ6_9ORYZ|nr:hypothetical protein E2562_020041 [Oryza meyeriana var. granulata]